ncbi:chromosome segregation protein SMC [Desulfosarcina ovata subsp. sediminis]|uniref:Chromosome segregation protein SMC n=1 Tax=Desulfosarcina ovata subsp. sediminis TaxID=885957 RepID=A0A5K7ZQW8_9BACT|nr:AAA family ATPase [Desulfosarcina ovata]BBO82420.1 chromosome segregation protein SMC [Desulfosarcina ovata subsp. sediminis]
MGTSLDKLTIKGFKSIRELKDFELKALNVFIGGNGAGKSNLIDFFRLLRNLIDGKLNEFIRSGGGISDFLFNGRKVTKRLEFETRFGVRGYRFCIEPGPSEKIFLTKEARYYRPGTTGWWELGDSPDGTSRLVKEAKGDSYDRKYSRPVYRAISSWQIYHFHDTSATAAMRHYEIIQDNKVLRFDAANIAPYLLRLKEKHADAYREILDSVRLVMPFFDDFLLDVVEFGEKQKVNLSWLQKGSDYPMQPYHLSDGSIRFICLATALMQPDPPSTIIIDEPELGLHPSAIAILAELIQNASNRTQLIVATQSPALIDHFSVEDVIVVNRKDGASTFERLKEEDFSAWLETYSVGELWSKNVISGGPTYE